MNSTMNIGYLTGQYPRATDTFIQREIAVLRQIGAHIQTFSVRPPAPEQLVGTEQQREFEQTIYLLPTHFFAILKAHAALLFTRHYFAALALAWQTRQPGIKGLIYQIFYFMEAGLLAQQLKRQALDHLHGHLADTSCTVAMLASALAGISFSFTIHGPYIFYEPYRWSLSEKIKRALFVVCISNFCRSQCMYFSDIKDWDKLRIIHCGVDPQFYNPVTHQGPGNQLLYVGRLSAAKGLPILLESLAQLKATHPKLRLTVIGDGPDRSQLEQMAHHLDLHHQVDFVGYKNQGDVQKLLQSADIFILPSFAEGVPVSLMEAMATGVPVISTQIAGISELVQDGVSGYLVPPGNTQALTQKIEILHTNTELRQSFGQAGRAYVTEAFNLQIEGHSLFELFKLSLEK